MEANKIKGYRKMIGYNQKQMAETLGITEVTYRQKENGQQEFKHSEMKEFQKAIKLILPSITVDEIFF
ncbi:MAG: helix-turn-helix domain-containing protein [Aerococcaceae bacterium]|nr:helix-turn-helix domain-containing protein [Aerococcaceae bacterium]